LANSYLIATRYYCPFDSKRPNLSYSDIPVSNYMRGVVRQVNKFFVSIALIAFYFFIIGIVSITMKIFIAFVQKKGHSSYWQNFKKYPWDKNYFESEY